MSKVVIDDSKLVNIADAIRNKNGSADKYTPTEMATAIGEIKVSSGAEIAPEDLVFSGDCSYKFQNGGWDWFIEKFGDKITTKDITGGKYMFYNCKLSSIPFDINFKAQNIIYTTQMFASSAITTVPYLKNFRVYDINRLFDNCVKIVEIPEDYFDTWDFSLANENSTTSFNNIFSQCYSLRKIPNDLSMFNTKTISNSSNFFNSTFYYCYCLEKITNLPVPSVVYSSRNVFNTTFYYCHRLKQLTFSLNDETPKIAKWQKQVIDLTYGIGYRSANVDLTNYGMSLDTEIRDDASYQLLKDNEDSWTKLVQYSRYNHDSAVETINTLPDTSAYLAESGGTTNIIKFKGASGSATDGGAINTLTEGEIAVAAAKGWSVSFV